MTHPFSRREWLLLAVLALIAALALVYAFNPRPTSLDSYYHANAAARWASGQGLTDTYLWVYLGLPADLPQPVVETPSHLYWMPATSLLSGASMKIFGTRYAAAQLPLALCLAGAILIAALAGGWAGGEKRHAILAAFLMAASSSYADMWGEVDTFAPYALFGSAALAAIIHARLTGGWKWWLLAGLLCGAGHLTRADGLLLPMVAVMIVLTSPRKSGIVALTAGYLAVMGIWFLRMIGAVGAPLPVGGLQTAYLTDYIQIFRYPWQTLSLGSVGLPALLQSRLDALPGNLATYFVSEGWLFLWPLTLWGLFRAQNALRLTVGLFALGLHAAMILVFAWPGARGGLFHGAAALMPFWAALTVTGAAALAQRLSRRPRRLEFTRQIVLGVVAATAAVATLLSLNPPKSPVEPPSVTALRPMLSPGDRAMATDPAQNYYYLGIGGVVLPDSPLDLLPEMAETFDLDYLVLEGIKTEADGGLDATAPVQFNALLSDVPLYLELVADFGHTRLYRFSR